MRPFHVLFALTGLFWLCGINTAGQVVGNSSTDTTASHGFLWSNGAMQDLGTLGGMDSVGFGINGGGQVVGYAHLPGNTAYHAFLWTDGAMQDLGTLGGNSSYAAGINDAGQITGTASTTGGTASRAFLWTDGAMQDLGTLGGNSSHAAGINGAGQVVGYSLLPGDLVAESHAFLWSDGVMQDLGTLGGTDSYATGINDAGQVVGYSHVSDNTAFHAFLWSDGVMQDLGTLGGTNSRAQGINDAGQVVGYSDLPGNAVYRALLWTNGVMQDLGTLGGAYSFAYGINDAGQITGTATTTGNTASHAFLWSNGVMQDLGTLGGGPGAISQGFAIGDIGVEAIQFSPPVDMDDIDGGRIWHDVQNFGSLSATGKPHLGEDWNWGGGTEDFGKPVYAIGDGEIFKIYEPTRRHDTWGQTIVLKHPCEECTTGNGNPVDVVYSMYAHLSSVAVLDDDGLPVPLLEGQTVKRGWPVGSVGDADGLYSPHLHFAVMTLEPPCRKTEFTCDVRGTGYSWDLAGWTDGSEFIENNKTFDLERLLTVYTHPYDAEFSVGHSWQLAGKDVDPDLGYGGHLYYSKTDKKSSTALWRPNVPRPGYYDVQVFIPRTFATTTNAKYTIIHGGQTDTVTINQSAHSQSFVSLGTFHFGAAGGEEISLDCATGESKLEVAADTVRLIEVRGEPTYSYLEHSGLVMREGLTFTGEICDGCFQTYAGMYFQPNNDYVNLRSLKFMVDKAGSPSDGITLDVYETADGSTASSLIATSEAIDGSSMVGESNWYNGCAAFETNNAELTEECFSAEFVFLQPIAFVAGQEYFILVRRTGAASSADYYIVSARASSDYPTDPENSAVKCDEHATCVSASRGVPVYTMWWPSQ